MFLGIYPFGPFGPFCWFITFSYNPLYFCGVCCSFSSLISEFIYLVLSLFFLMSLFKGLSILFIFSKNQLLDSLIIYIIFFESNLFLHVSLLLPSFHSLWASLVFFFFQLPLSKIRLFI